MSFQILNFKPVLRPYRDYYSVQEISFIMGVTPGSIYRHIKVGLLPCVFHHRGHSLVRRVDHNDFMDYLDTHATDTSRAWVAYNNGDNTVPYGGVPIAADQPQSAADAKPKLHYTLKEVSEIFGVSICALRKYIRTGKLPAFTLKPGPNQPLLIDCQELFIFANTFGFPVLPREWDASVDPAEEPVTAPTQDFEQMRLENIRLRRELEEANKALEGSNKALAAIKIVTDHFVK